MKTTTTKVELPIKKTYLPGWGKWEGVREIIQNGLDQEVQGGNELDVRLCQVNEVNAVAVTNKGATLDPRAFLFGHTTKEGDDRCIGQFGEGLKLGVLALLREGIGIIIDVGRDRWTARFTKSRKFGGEIILAFDIEKNIHEEPKDVTVYMVGLTEAEFKALVLDKFLNVGSGKEIKRLKGCGDFHGMLILDQAMKGRVFVKGIWVEDRTDLEFGYDLQNVRLNRDRNLVADWDLGYHTAHIITNVLGNDKNSEFSKQILDRAYNNILLNPSSKEARELSSCLWVDQRKTLADMFQEEHGKKAIPVSTQDGAKQAEFLGRSGVVVTQAMADALSPVKGMGADAEVKGTTITNVYDQDSLTKDEKAKIADSCSMISLTGVLTITPDEVKIVDYNKDNVMGMYFIGQIGIARKILANSLDVVLGVLVHEVAHRIAADGTRDHCDIQTMILSKIAVVLWAKLARPW